MDYLKVNPLPLLKGVRLVALALTLAALPPKPLWQVPRLAYMAKRAAEYSVMTGDVHIDFDKIMARMNKIRGNSSSGMEKWFNSLEQVTLFQCWAKFEDTKHCV